MRAIVCTRYGLPDVLQLRDVPKPIPKDDEVLVRIRATTTGAHVTAVDSGPKLEMLRTIGADRVIDYAREDVTAGPETFDVIFDIVRDTPSRRLVRMLTGNGWLLMANPGFLQIVRARWGARGTGKRVSFAASGVTNEDLVHLRALVEGGRLHPVIDRTFPFEQMAEAHRYAESGQKQGNVVVVVAQAGSQQAGLRPSTPPSA